MIVSVLVQVQIQAPYAIGNQFPTALIDIPALLLRATLVRRYAFPMWSSCSPRWNLFDYFVPSWGPCPRFPIVVLTSSRVAYFTFHYSIRFLNGPTINRRWSFRKNFTSLFRVHRFILYSYLPVCIGEVPTLTLVS